MYVFVRVISQDHRTMAIEWSDLRVFLSLAREGKLSATARLLDVSHPTIARRVKALESSVGARPFERPPHRFRLTSAGEGIVGHVPAPEPTRASRYLRNAPLGGTHR